MLRQYLHTGCEAPQGTGVHECNYTTLHLIHLRCKVCATDTPAVPCGVKELPNVLGCEEASAPSFKCTVGAKCPTGALQISVAVEAKTLLSKIVQLAELPNVVRSKGLYIKDVKKTNGVKLCSRPACGKSVTVGW